MTFNALGLIALGAGAPFDGEDLLAGLGVPPDASARVRELVIKGLLYEMAEAERWSAEMCRRASKSARRRGRPKRVLLEIDAHRALYIIHRTRHFEAPQGEDMAFIRDAMASEAERRSLGLVEPAYLLWGTDEGTLAKSVSKGRKELAERAKAEEMTLRSGSPRSYPKVTATRQLNPKCLTQFDNPLCAHLQRCGGRHVRPTSQVSVRPCGR